MALVWTGTISLNDAKGKPADWTIGISDNRGAAVNRLAYATEQFMKSNGG